MKLYRNEINGKGWGDKATEIPIVRPLGKIFLEKGSVPSENFVYIYNL